MTDPNRTARTGKKAPWPKGKPRNPPDPRWPALRKRLARELANVDRNGAAGTNQRSGVYIAAMCGVSGSTLCKWRAGSRNPPWAAVQIIENWLDTIRG